MRKSIALSMFLLCIPARAELLKFEDAGDDIRAVFRDDGKEFALAGKLLRTKKPAPDGALFVELAQDDDLRPTAVSRGMTVAALDLITLPPGLRARALRDLLPRLREKSAAKRILAHGKGEMGAALVEAGALFDGLLLQDVEAIPSGAAKAPRTIETWGADAYWRATPRAAPGGPEPQNRRSFFLAGAAAPGAAANCAASANVRSGRPALRALLVALDEWTRGTKPPASRAPGAADLVTAGALVWPKIPGLPAPPAGERLVPRIDADGNELSGLRLPDQALPIATFTGFNAQKDKGGPPCVAGATLPFPTTKAEREKAADPRPSLVERYGSRAYFVATMRVVADRLVKERLLLPEDADAYVAAAKTAPF
ncbi:alpha/beta hydrolase domain-containing protein [Methylocystis sp. ATCC 49242]|uniref:alpha/beta hydrolase domain-containing protein n=1 Tax=Methylocystis sp. ATCC 49242 TaxID=622637 RepID=UPI0001F87BCB|nr:alpha/beta hydrolase domain-containing protein [Methylocystis sp. ATCC 49242]